MNLEVIIRLSQDILDLREMLKEAEAKLESCIGNNRSNPEAQPTEGAQVSERPSRQTRAGTAYKYTGQAYVHTAKKNNIGIIEFSDNSNSLPIAVWLTVDQVEQVRHLVYLYRLEKGHRVPDKYRNN